MKAVMGGSGAGYTIVETMIFLAVSAAMFVSAMALLSGRQARTEFVAAVRNYEADLTDVAGDVSNGYYNGSDADSGRLSCSPVLSGFPAVVRPNPSTNPLISQQRGGNQGCTFIGKTIQFAPSGSNGSSYVTMSMAGLQYINGTAALGDAMSIDDSRAAVIPGPETTQLGGAATVGCVLWTDGTPPSNLTNNPCNSGMQKTGALTFLTTYQATNYQDSGSNHVDTLIPVGGAAIDTNSDTSFAMNQVQKFSSATLKAPKGGVFICLESTGSDQHALISIGGAASRFNVSTNIDAGKCS